MIPSELMTSNEQYRAERNTRIVARYKALKEAYPDVLPGRLYAVIAREELMTSNNVKYIVKKEMGEDATGK